jgi:hypothetical protein
MILASYRRLDFYSRGNAALIEQEIYLLTTKTASSEGIKKWTSNEVAHSLLQKGPDEYFTGTVRIDPLLEAHEPARSNPKRRTTKHVASATTGDDLCHHSGGTRRQARELDRTGQRQQYQAPNINN